ncbi:probable GTP-binding protein OBGC2 [Glycine soja]|nr:probable GTP-binding protein OBGC2 [Glycine soja]
MGFLERISYSHSVGSSCTEIRIMVSLISTSPPSSSFNIHPFFSPRGVQFRHNCVNYKRKTVRCAVTSADASPPPSTSLAKEPHKYFDHVIITVRAGDGGHGAVLNQQQQQQQQQQQGKTKLKKGKGSLKRDFDGSLILPMGGHGGDVVLYADESKDTLLEFHNKGRYHAKRGGNVDAMGVLTSMLRDGLAAPTLRIAVPVGTVVKSKRGKMLADLAQPWDEVLVARGGQGGISLLEMPQHKRKKMMALTTNVMRDDSDKVLIHGQPGEEVKLELILRVVADVGLIGLPNAGKSTLLAAITLAKPDIADYPFTTLMPNLGRLGGDPSLGAGMYSSEATLADLPGLIEGAHLGKGLGRNFLRHLRRTRLLVHVVDAATENPINDYRTVREELRMYNPEYLDRPYVVILNKIDLPEAKDKLPSLTQEIMRIGNDGAASDPKPSPEVLDPLSDETDRKEKRLEDYPRPLSVVGVSVLKGIRINEMLKEIRSALRKCSDSKEALAFSVPP